MKTWLITGCSTGFGRELATAALAHGQQVAVTARHPGDIADIVAPYDSSAALALALDVTDPESVSIAVAAGHEHFGSIDVLLNNAGISYFGGVEESDPQAVRRLFEINFFGLMRVTNAVLPLMREQRSGTIVNLASIAGLNGFPGVGYYSASKFAVEGVSEALAQEVDAFGIRVLLVEPSAFRTDWARSSATVAEPIAAYDRTPLRQQVEAASDPATPLPGDPAKAAGAIIADVLRSGSNLHLPLGAASYLATTAKLDRLRAEYDALEQIARAADDLPAAV
ncbi:short-chain dehydrogenase/reductase [Microlunatus endophyticus]|uniref:Short-chain dehydrogenase/reductase n=1 Tax=Microlunatus endophyticus TaxID=1716077 RepID=A0A917W994_9ACTN|nr:oxidoreductase [Microlunatus endophyticus]GGL80269.1 short-chain dehydrogenase/reductase [Microlunatus endophyticus]